MMSLENEDSSARPLELWGGIECTVNRVGDAFFDQIAWSGHQRRPEDLALFAGLGLRAIRYPVLWERVAPENMQAMSWEWSDERLGLLRSLDVRPIVGLLHHGSGPRYSSLLDPAFPRNFATFSRKVAERYPWVDAYTPINEPLTTARFSGLYGHWYPHRSDARSFIRILINQIRATQQAMCAIREINPAAQLVQTDDLGKVYSSQALVYQALHENERRWLTFDLLCGRVDNQHPLFDYLVSLGITTGELDQLRRDATPPDILGINYYVTSERYLDDRINLFPAWMHGGNGRHTYVDLEAVRVRSDDPASHTGILQEAWDRYKIPLALTEVHLGGHREQQLRWWVEAWNAVQTVRGRGVDVRAITAWALLGNFNWSNLVTQDLGLYESGVFDVRGSQPRPTVLAQAVKAMAKGDPFDHPALDTRGWWQSERRLLYPPMSTAEPPASQPALQAPSSKRAVRRVLITGASGTLGQAFQRICEARDIPFLSVSHEELDITDEKAVDHLLSEVQPWAVINTAGYVRVDEAESQPEACFSANAIGPAILARLCADRGTALMSFSSDLVFNGAHLTPYLESDIPEPLNAYGISKAEGEGLILEANPRALIIRTGALFGPWDSANFLAQVGRSISAKQEYIAAGDVLVSPTYVPDLVHASLDLLVDGEKGLWHLANQGEVSWFDFASRFALAAELSISYLRKSPVAFLPFIATRPHYSVLSSERGLLMPVLDDAIFRFVRAASVASPA